MGLKKITVMFLGIGAIFAFTGGLGVCAYNCRWYDKNNAWGRGYESVWKRPLDCTLSSGIFGIFRAVLALIALILLLVDVNKIVVAVLFIIDLVLYLGELIPEALIIDDVKYRMRVNPECDTNSDVYKWMDGGYTDADNQKNQGLTPGDIQKQASWSQIKSFIAGLDTQTCRYWDPGREPIGIMTGEWRDKGAVSSCVIDYKASTIPQPALVSQDFPPKDNCDDYNIVAECHGGWSEGALTSQAKKACKQYWSLQEELFKGSSAGFTTSEDYKKWTLDVQKRTGKKYMDWAIADTAPASITEVAVNLYVSSFSLANQILLGCQTIAFVATLVGVILLLVRKVAKVSSKP